MPGSLPLQHIRKLVTDGRILGSKADHLQPSSLDLSLSTEVYRMRGTFLPRPGERIRDLVRHGSIYKASLDTPFEINGIYLCRLNETLVLPNTIHATTNNKSSTGRVNVRTRLLVDGMSEFDRVPEGYTGELWLEIIPKSFPVKFAEDERLNQMRFFEGDARLTPDEHRRAHANEHLLCDPQGNAVYGEYFFAGGGLTMTADLSGHDIIGYKCSPTTGRVLEYARRDYAADEFFEPIPRPPRGEIMLKKDEFYILATKEGVRVPLDYSVEMAPYDVGKGEFRSHYAGFFDPGFGFGPNGDVRGDQAVLEVFTHDNDFVLRDGQPICTMIYERILERPEIAYGDPRLGNNYFRQSGPRLSKHFAR